MSRYSIFILLCILMISGKIMAYCPCECWQGGYITAQGAHIWQKTSAKFTNNNYFNTIGPQLLGNHFSFRSNRYVGGVAIGTNYQNDCFVMGYEAGGLVINHKQTRVSPFFPATDTFTSSLNWLANIKMRAGLAYNRFFTYITGGWAGGSTELKLHDNFANVIAKKCRWVNGWVIGAGVDCKLWSCLSLGVEYNYTQLEYRRQRLSCQSCGNGIGLGSPRVTNCHQIQTVCLRLTFLFC